MHIGICVCVYTYIHIYVYIYIYISESLFCTAEINTTLLINYISIKYIKKKKKTWGRSAAEITKGNYEECSNWGWEVPSLWWWQLLVHPSWYFQEGTWASVVTLAELKANQNLNLISLEEKRLNVILVCGPTIQTLTAIYPCKGYPHKEMWIKINTLGIRKHN